MEDINPDLGFIEMPDVRELEAQLGAQLKELCERNEQLTRRNAELRASAEIGWNAEVQFKKFGMVEADLTEEIRNLRFEREQIAAALINKDKAISQLKTAADAQAAEVRSLQQKASRFQQDYDAQIEELGRQLARSRQEEARLSAEFAQMQTRHEQTSALAKTTFDAQLSDLGKIAWNAGVEVQNLKEALAAAQAETANIRDRLAGQDESYRTQLNQLAQSGLESEREMADAQKNQAELTSEVSRQRANYEKTVSELRRALEHERTAHAQVREREAVLRAEAEKTADLAKRLNIEAAQAEEAKRRAVSEALQFKNAELAQAIEAKAHAEAQVEAQKNSVASMSSDLNARMREVREAQATIQKQMDIIGDQTRSAQERMAEMGALRVKTESLQSQLNAQSEAIHAKDQILTTFKREAAYKDEIIQRQIKTLSHLTKIDKDKEVEIQRFRLAEVSLNETVLELRAAGQERDALRKKVEEHADRVSARLNEVQNQAGHEIMSLNTQLQAARAQNESTRAAISQISIEKDQLRAQLIEERETLRSHLTETLATTRARLEEELAEVRERLGRERDQLRAQLEHERESARQISLIQNDRALSERHELDRLNAALEQREYQLRHYAASVSEEKSEVLRRAKALAEEIKAAATLAPLKDYLALTEFELGKVELQLRKTPVISIERPRLEANYGQMIEQRDFLKKAIASSQQQLDQQAAQLLKIAKPEKLSPIPPLPPRKTSV